MQLIPGYGSKHIKMDRLSSPFLRMEAISLLPIKMICTGFLKPAEKQLIFARCLPLYHYMPAGQGSGWIPLGCSSGKCQKYAGVNWTKASASSWKERLRY